MQTPPEYVAIPAMVGAATVVGRKVAIRPKQHDDWKEVPNLWGCIIGRPGVMKSPAIGQALKPIGRLAALAGEQFEQGTRSIRRGRTWSASCGRTRPRRR